MKPLAYLFSDSLSPITPGGLPQTAATQGSVHGILQIVFSILGAVALLVITIAGLRYITSAGDPQKAANARNTIVLALVGLAVAIMAEALITFVVKGTT
jgi:uncharacterized membrane protein